jgi:ABC-type transport system substrate-binding protein
MSKVDTFLKIIEYRKEHPDATDAQISSAVGISERYVRFCSKELQELSNHFLKSFLSRIELYTLISKLEPNNDHELTILNKLQRLYLGGSDGILETASLEDRLSKDYLRIGIWSPTNAREHLKFWLESLLYEPLLRDEEGEEIDYRLASECENLGEYSRWLVKLKGGIYWSDGKPITSDDVIYTLARSPTASNIKEIEKANEQDLTLTLNRANPMFRHGLGHVPILPSHTSSYSVISGPFALRKSMSQKRFHLYRNKDYYRADYPKIEWISLNIYKSFAFAVRALERKSLDILPISSIHQVDERSSMVPQRLLNKGFSYYMLLVNQRKGGCLKDKGAMDWLKSSIDYNDMNLYLLGNLPQETPKSRSSRRKFDLTIGYLADMDFQIMRELSLLIASSLGVSPVNVVNAKGNPAIGPEDVDIFISRIYLGYGYSRLRRYFHSKGESNIFGFNYPEVDSLIDKLDETALVRGREIIGQAILQELQRENAVIILAPSFEYLLSNLYITPCPAFCSISELIFNLPNVRVTRKRTSGKV